MRYCTYCGREIVDDSEFCAFCGKQIPEEHKNETAQYAVRTVSPAEPQKNDLGLAIAAVVLSCMVVTSVVGLILGIISLSKAKKNAGGAAYTGKNKIAWVLSVVAIPLGAVMSVYAIYLFVIYLVYFLGVIGLISGSIYDSIGNQPAVLTSLFMC